MNIKTLIFDLGGVIIDLDEQATIKAFAKLCDQSPEDIASSYYRNPIFQQYEKGLISDAEFRSGLNEMNNTQHADELLDHAWNAMLGNIPIERLDFLRELQKSHQVLILSNTNSIHVRAFNKILEHNSGESGMHAFAHQVFYSHELKMRKPDAEIYEEVLKQSGADPALSLFLDDKKENLLGAESVGIHTIHITHPDQIFTLEKHA